jgi:hypothetical protein
MQTGAIDGRSLDNGAQLFPPEPQIVWKHLVGGSHPFGVMTARPLILPSWSS